MKFVVGLLLGLGAGAAAAIALSQRDAEEGMIKTVQANMNSALQSAKKAAEYREKELWNEFRDRVPAENPTTYA
ncbi:MAG: hypothetical protein KAX40_07875 [Herpetosiphon sp.]|nr:hypothetical protein [Herpetosiphon sp.]